MRLAVLLVAVAVALALGWSAPATAQTVTWSTSAGFRDWGSPLLDRDLVFAGNHTGVGGFYALDARTGKIRWKRPARAASLKPLVAGDLVYAYVNDEQDPASRVLALRRRDGAQVWTRAFPRWAAGGLSSDGRLLFVPSDGDATLFALDLASGREVWAFRYGTARGTHTTAPVYHEGRVFLATEDEPAAVDIGVKTMGKNVFAVEAATGKRVWATPVVDDPDDGIEAHARPLSVSGELVYTTAASDLIALDRATGAQRWRVPIRSQEDRGLPLSGPVVLPGGRLIVLSTEAVLAFDARTGAPAWKTPGHFYQDPEYTPPAGDGRLLVAPHLDEDGDCTLWGMDPATGRIAWRHRLAGWAPRGIVVQDGTVITHARKTLLRLAVR